MWDRKRSWKRSGHRFPDRQLELHLEALDGKQCARLLGNLLTIDPRPHTTRAVILSKTEGNPFFIEEVIRSLIEQEAIVKTEAGLRVTDKIDSIEVPATVHEVVMARVDRLPEDVRRVLQLASVIGRNIPVRVLAAVADEHKAVGSALEYLEHAQLLEARQTGDDADYVFKHALAREAVYESLLLRTRRDLHRAIAQSIESLYAERLPQYFGMLAYHFSRAELPEKAEYYLFKAGEQAVLAAGSSEALHYFEEASRLYFQIHGGAATRTRRPSSRRTSDSPCSTVATCSAAWTTSIEPCGSWGTRTHNGTRDPPPAARRRGCARVSCLAAANCWHGSQYRSRDVRDTIPSGTSTNDERPESLLLRLHQYREETHRN